MRVNPPYDRVDYWRQGQSPGGVLPGAGRIYGRLVDDSWQHALFTRDTLTDLTPETIREVLRIVTLYPSGVLDGAEDMFYHTLEQLWRSSTFRQVA